MSAGPSGAPSAVHGSILALLAGRETAVDWPLAVPQAIRHGVGPLLHRALVRSGQLPGIPRALADELHVERQQVGLANLGFLAAFRKAATALSSLGIRTMPLKGLHLAEHVYRDISLRPMSDVDVLVERSMVARALRCLAASGFGPYADLGPAIDKVLEAKCNIGLNHSVDGLLVEVHWALDEPGGAGPGPVDSIWRHAREGAIGGVVVPTMPNEYLLLHVCAHLACNHAFAFSLRALCDIREIVDRSPGLDWALVIDQATAHPWARGVAASLRLARDHLDAAVPQRVLRETGALDLDPEMLAQAMTQLLQVPDFPAGLASAPSLLSMASQQDRLAKIRLLLRRAFPQAIEMATLYGVRPGSPRIPLLYVRRIRDLLVRHRATLGDLSRPASLAVEAARRDADLRRWIRGS